MCGFETVRLALPYMSVTIYGRTLRPCVGMLTFRRPVPISDIACHVYDTNLDHNGAVGVIAQRGRITPQCMAMVWHWRW